MFSPRILGIKRKPLVAYEPAWIFPRRGGAYSNLHSDPGGSPSYGNSAGEEIPPSSALLQLNQMLKQLDTLTSDVSYRWS